jgi:hypothetical protein
MCKLLDLRKLNLRFNCQPLHMRFMGTEVENRFPDFKVYEIKFAILPI